MSAGTASTCTYTVPDGLALRILYGPRQLEDILLHAMPQQPKLSQGAFGGGCITDDSSGM